MDCLPKTKQQISQRMGRMRILVRSASNHSAAEVFDLAAGNGTVVLWLNLEEQEKQRGEKVCSVIFHIPPPLSVATGKRRGRVTALTDAVFL